MDLVSLCFGSVLLGLSFHSWLAGIGTFFVAIGIVAALRN